MTFFLFPLNLHGGLLFLFLEKKSNHYHFMINHYFFSLKNLDRGYNKRKVIYYFIFIHMTKVDQQFDYLVIVKH